MNMTVFSILPRMGAEHVAAQALYRQCRAHGVDVHWQQLPVVGCYLHFTLRHGGGSMSCLVDVAEWACKRLPGVAGVAWDELDTRSGHLLFGSCPQPLHLESPALQYEQATYDGLVPGTRLAMAEIPWPCVPSNEGTIWIESLDKSYAQAPVSPSLPTKLALSVRYRIGNVQLRSGQLRTLRCNDVVLLGEIAGRAMVNRHSLFSFNFNLENVVVNDTFSPPFDDSDEPLAQPPIQRDLDLASLPISIDVVLCTLSQTLADLGQLEQGTTLSVPIDAHRNVELQVNGQCVAAGELVQVGDVLGVQIQRMLLKP
ncbi:type III secretion system cytoplasmic ring protein SctQ [Dyella sp. Tek66A03]|uniref:type III secretion system cytoplasmic ring protein SctQ n=1 Tax=Dyella sp. Tek66A03 TaxID=3458298 RepID=UPI00403EDC3F